MKIKEKIIRMAKGGAVFVLAVVMDIHCVLGADYELQKTMLMFVGEDQDILSIASGREESAWQAPAVASVLDQQPMRARHDATVADALDTVTGFCVKQTESKLASYTRGIPDGALYLYDTVPMESVNNVSLHAVKRVEIIKGPGSVLWGPDAFAGIVNVVPLTGKDLNGSETGLLYASKNSAAGAYLNSGFNHGQWDGFLSVSGSRKEKESFNSVITRFWGDGEFPVQPSDRTGHTDQDRAEFMEVIGNLSYGDGFRVSTRFSDSVEPVTLTSETDGVDDIQWKELRKVRTGFVTLEGKKGFGIDSALRFTGTASMLESEVKVIDKNLDQQEYDLYGEMLYERMFDSGDSLLTAGISYRRGKNEGVPLWDSYLPSYLVDENDSFLPSLDQADYTTTLWSFFTQYRKTLGDVDLIFGIRNDEHDSFDDNISYNSGIVWSPSESWVCKALLGTAYRTPSEKQLFNTNKSELEEIKSINLEISRKWGERAEVSLSGFFNKLKNHTMDDPYSGLSLANSQDIKGVELQCSLSPVDSVSISSGLTLLNNSGPDEAYLYNEYSSLNPDGTIEDHFVELKYPYDMGPDKLFNLTLLWSITDTVDFFAETRYFAGYKLTYPHVTEDYNTLRSEVVECDSTWLSDIGITLRNFVVPDSDLEIKLTNVFDKKYYIPGTYSLEQGGPFCFGMVWRKRW